MGPAFVYIMQSIGHEFIKSTLDMIKLKILALDRLFDQFSKVRNEKNTMSL